MGFLAAVCHPGTYSQQGPKTRRFQLLKLVRVLRVYLDSSSGLSALKWVRQPRLAIVVMKLPSG